LTGATGTSVQARIECAGVRYTYPGGVRALEGVDLEVTAGERVAIVGQNGSGKTTLIRHFNGLLKPEAGTVRVAGHETTSRTVAQLARVVGLAFQDPDRQIFANSVQDEVAFGARNIGLRGPELENAVTSALSAVGLGDERKSNPYDLGYSRRKLLTIASVLAMGTPILVLDEPTTGQDARGVETLGQIVREASGAGRGVICVSHDMAFVAENFERVIVMRQGRIVLDGLPAEVFAPTNWETLSSTNLRPPYAATVGQKLGLGSTPTADELVRALAGRG
jgi:energy-coupling factor transport system ATP-binding protein